MRWTTVILTVVLVLGSSLTAWSKGVTFDTAARLAIVEARAAEDVILADGVTQFSPGGRKLLRRLRKGRDALQKALDKRGEGETIAGARLVRKGLERLQKGFRIFEKSYPSEAGALQTMNLAYEKADDFVTTEIASLRPRVDALRAGGDKKIVEDSLTTATRIQARLSRFGGIWERARARERVMKAYFHVSYVRQVIGDMEERARQRANNPTNGIPGNLPRGGYAVAISVNGSSAVEQGVIRNTGGAQLRNALRKLVQALMRGHQQQGCTTTATSTPFNGTRFTVGARIRCPDGDGDTETTVLNFVITKVN